MTQQKSDLHSVPNLLDKNLNQETKNFDLIDFSQTIRLFCSFARERDHSRLSA